MRLLLDENLARASAAALRAAGHDVETVADVRPGMPDREVLEHARASARVLMTFDQDFGELVFRLGLAPDPGIILIRLPTTSPDEQAEVAVLAATLVEARLDEFGHAAPFFATVRAGHIAFRLLRS